jgi:hypothetical protein
MCFAFSPLPLKSSSAQNLSKINAMINQLVVESLTVFTGKLYYILLYRLGEIRTHIVSGDRY